MNLFEALSNTEFGETVEFDGRKWVVIKDFPDDTALAVEAGAGFPAQVFVIQVGKGGRQ